MDFRILVFVAAAICVSRADLLMPPAFIQAPPFEVQYLTNKAGDSLTLPCVAIGNPKPNYEWKLNGVTFDITPTRDGTIIINSPVDSSKVGFYQCFARNSEGVAMSNTTRVVLAAQAAFPDSQPTQQQGTLGLPLKLSCNPTSYGIPMPKPSAAINELKWQINDGQPYALKKRVQIDDSGNLNIGYLMAEDLAVEMYTCYIRNRILNVDVGGTQTRIVAADPNAIQAPPKAPTIMFFTNQSQNAASGKTVVVGLEGKNISIRCFFAGSSDIGITWTRTDGVQLPTDGRILRINFNIEMIITNAQKSDEGEYACTGSGSGFPAVDFPISVRVHAAPKFVNPVTDGPRDFNLTVGEYVKINCSARAIPDATVQWFKNGVPLSPNSLPAGSKFQFSPDFKMLTYGPVCKDNCSGDNDLMVLQCNASNVYGYALANGYINVFVRTVITMKSENLTLDNQKEVSFTVKATTDPNTPLTYAWYKKGDCSNDWCTVFNVTDKNLIMSDDGSQFTIFYPVSSDATNYKCVASNGVSIDEAYFKLVEPLIPAYVWPYWWIPLLILLLILLIILIVCCVCCYMRRNRGDEYPVDEKERAADRNPEKELIDSGFHDYQRPEGLMQISTLQRPGGRLAGPVGTGGGPGSINSSIGKPMSEDDMSLNDYASFNAGKFTEDGSFIGQYNPSLKRPVTTAPWPADSRA